MYVLGGDGVDRASERVLLDMPRPRPIHQSGTLEFGSDGYLYGARWATG